MAEFVKIIYGDAPVGTRIKNTRKVGIIGTATSYSGVIDNVNNADVLIDGTSYPGILVTDPIYLAAKDYLTASNGASDLLLYAVPSSATTVENVEFVGPKNGVNTLYTCSYSPLSGINGNLEIYITGSTVATTAEWYDVVGGWSMLGAGTSGTDLVWNGGIQLDGTGVSITGIAGGSEVTGTITGITLDDGTYRLRADLILDPMCYVSKELGKSDYAFQFFTFAYDPSKACPSAPEPGDDFKYASGNCYSGKSWMKDLYYGQALAGAWNSIGQRTMFVFSLPESVNQNEAIATGYTMDTAYETTSIKYEEIMQNLGNDKFTVLARATQLIDANTVDPAIDLMATRMKSAYRDTTLMAPTTLGQSDPPDNTESFAWRAAQINAVGSVKGLIGAVWLGNFTLGAGDDKHINHIQCKNLLANKIEEKLYTILASRKVRYDYKGMKTIEGAIFAAMNEATNIDKIIDGPDSVEIPIMAYLAQEGSLTEGDQLIVDNARDTGVVSNITVKYLWKGDVEQIIISTFINA